MAMIIDHAESVIIVESGTVESAKNGDIVPCAGTIDPPAASRFAERLAANGMAVFDTPPSGDTRALRLELYR